MKLQRSLCLVDFLRMSALSICIFQNARFKIDLNYILL